ncbi:hypothetical protein BJY04DRAFT_218368 [Aspergillus karnatakaensis]|uniref:2EXR domain-containing protein n=1 Tax=Aspergillus karnatakaensis TaxID=1810916 RepID=UPI003CCCCD3B
MSLSTIPSAGSESEPKQRCPLSVNGLFKDPRSPAPPLSSPEAIICNHLRENAPSTKFWNTVIEAYAPNDPRPEPTFPNFRNLPKEIRHMIWKYAIPVRTLDVNEVSRDRTDNKYRGLQVLPMPSIAHECSEARKVVLRAGKLLAVYEQVSDLYINLDLHATHWSVLSKPTNKLDDLKDDTRYHLAGFLLPNDNIVYYKPFVQRVDACLQLRCSPEGFPVTDPRILPQVSGGQKVACWLGGDVHEVSKGIRPCPLHSIRDCTVKRWDFLTKMDRLDTIFVLPFDWCAYPISHAPNEHQRKAFRKAYFSTSRKAAARYFRPDYGVGTILVDLYDDQTLAQITSLNTGLDGLPACAKRPWLPCINCQRRFWEQTHKKGAERFWLLLHSDELDRVEAAQVFPEGTPAGMATIPYNSDHPWVKEKLSQVPDIRPAVSFKIEPCLNPGTAR